MGIYNFPHSHNYDSDLYFLIRKWKELTSLGKSQQEAIDEINQWRKTLDLQDEVNNKIDEFLKDGTLGELISIFTNYITPQMYGAIGDGIADDTQALNDMFNYALSHTPITIYIPVGTYLYSSLPIINKSDINIIGENAKNTILQCTNTAPNHNCIEINAFNTQTMTPILYHANLKNLTFIGNAFSKNIIFAQGFAQNEWSNIYLKGLNINCTGFNIKGVHETTFNKLVIGANYTDDTNQGLYGLYLDQSTRGPSASVEGPTTNNTFISCYFENCNYGCYLEHSDQNTFISCACQNDDVGLYVGNSNRINTFIGLAVEHNSTTDIVENGRNSIFINCYTADKTFIINGVNGIIDGGMFPNLTIDSNAIGYRITNCRVNSANGGLTVRNYNNDFNHIHDINPSQSKFLSIIPNRQAITIPDGNTYTYKNTTNSVLDIYIQGGVVTQTLKLIGTGQVVISNSYFQLLPGESVKINFTTKPSLSFVQRKLY